MADKSAAPANLPRRRSVKSRVRSGCITCKIRHVKCDEIKPICLRCQQFAYKCEGYSYGSAITRSLPGLNSPSTSSSSQDPPVPISREQRRPQIRTHAQLSPVSSSSSTNKHSYYGPTSVSDESTVAAEKNQEEIDLKKLVADSRISPQVSPTSDDYLEKVFRFSIQKVFPNLLMSGVENPKGHEWIRLAVENPAALQVRLYSTELYHRVLFRRPLNPTTNLLAIHAETIKLLNEQLQNPVTACSDGNILAVGGLAFFGQNVPKPKPISSGSLPSQGPLNNLHGLNVYSQMIYDPVHLKGLDMLIKIRGGLETIRASGIAAVTSYGDIMNASESLTPPRHFFSPMIDAPIILDIGRQNSPTGTQTSLLDLGSGFPVYWQHSDLKSLQDLSAVVQSMAAYTAIVYNHCQGIALQENKAKLADMRNSVQHRLLSLPSAEKLGTIPYPLYEATRLAALTYSLLVIFPIHGPRAPFAELASQLRFNLLLDLNRQKPSKHLLWILVIGAIASLNTENRAGFISAVRQFSFRLMIKTWEDLKDVLGCFLWLDITNDANGVKIWQEVESLKE